jgi:peptide/nickel transport system permease protein
MKRRIGLALLIGFGVLAVAAPWLAPVGPSAATDVVLTRFLPPGTVDEFGVVHFLGTDRLGRDVWSRLIHGARVSLAVGMLATLVSLAVGVVVGAGAAFLRGAPSLLLLGVTDFALALPRVVLLLLLAALWQPSAALVIVTLGLTGWMPLARLVYAETLSQLARPYATAGAALGAGRRRMFLRHILPNIAAPILAAATLGVGNAITLEAGLSFLGLGVQPPTPSWGGLIASGRETIVNAPWVGLAPGIALVLVVIACSLAAEGFEAEA